MCDSDNARPHWNEVWFGDRPDAIRYWLIGCGQRRLEGNFSDVVAGLVDVSLNDFAFLIDDTDEATALFRETGASRVMLFLVKETMRPELRLPARYLF